MTTSSCENDDVCFESKLVVDKFNNFFCTVASKRVKKIHKRNFDEGKIFYFYKNKGVHQNTFKFNVVSEEEVQKILKSLNVSKSTGADNISAKFLKESSSSFYTATVV